MQKYTFINDTLLDKTLVHRELIQVPALFLNLQFAAVCQVAFQGAVAVSFLLLLSLFLSIHVQPV